MRHSSTVFLKTLCLSIGTVLALSACSTTTMSSPRSGTDPYDKYYGQTTAQSSDVVDSGSIIVNPSAPQTYTVKKGDTLWGIARKFLHTPWHWPEIWDKNQRVANPHQLYPGDVLTLDYAGGGSGNKLQPRIRVDQRGQGEPIATLAPFTVWPRVLDEATIKNAPYILASRDDHALIAEGETIYVKNLRNTQVGERCAIFHPNEALHDPHTGALLGYEVTYGGFSRVERVDSTSTATVLDAQREIRKGDRLFTAVDEVDQLQGVIHAPTHKVRGDIVSLFDAEEIAGNYMVAVINQGIRDRIEVGHTLGVYTQGRYVVDEVESCKKKSGAVCSQLPPEKVANLVIYKVTDRVSYGLVMDASREVRNGDQIGNP
ncbi:LysM peptidoglycan-binding domain-containing protein [Thiothrix fructosivorans]|uniref:LysM peptidoglycan-binding domain-containing protein n=1 Tax=Thiothrix fructosivorans TaxID=111770 RepID=A0A8B0SLC1_9GAMM|nr:LysM peptidoglycan-binding domain-containing protein [Thiothrix fructosivorans]MBO0612380.1 LysM peptidoglycan-binding domain-containing protein [Thiothrix fructosivorans]QTX12136.1 LysM peptidoglycan-binding domain-containing protein [Thiothrix fructosivorans]